MLSRNGETIPVPAGPLDAESPLRFCMLQGIIRINLFGKGSEIIMYGDLMDTIGFVSKADPEIGAAMARSVSQQASGRRRKLWFSHEEW